MTDLEWTDEPPEEPGWYWIDHARFSMNQIAQVLFDGGELVVYLPTGESHGIGGRFQPTVHRWAGPISEPD